VYVNHPGNLFFIMDPIANMLTSITNAQAARKPTLVVPFSNVKLAIAELLARQGYVASVERGKRKARTAEVDVITLTLKYTNGEGAISGARLISKPSRHLYSKASQLRPVRSGYGIAVLTTPAGIMTNVEARKARTGGEVLFEIW
jgi:small subunit ribosomal protein S8